MEKYIPKDKLVAEIERLYKAHSGKHGCDEVGLNLEYLKDFLDTLEVIEIGVDVDSPEGDLGRKTVQVIDADGNISEVTFDKVQKGENV